MAREERCNFCGKRRDKVRRLVAGPGVFICDQCVELCSEVLRNEGPPAQAAPGRRPSWRRRQGRSGWFRNLFRVHGYTT